MSDLSYFVPQTLLPLERDVDWYVDKLFPNISTWRREANGRGGDKTILCDRFLNHILPYFVEVLIQDGVFFIKEFPEHSLTRLLRVREQLHYLWCL